MQPLLQPDRASVLADPWCLCQPDSGIARLLFWLVAIGLPLAIIVVGGAWSARRHGREQADAERREEVGP